ncbi:calmodulin regulator protein PCP4a isoform X1 [Archocentrus centrarchus]|uniref:calmodulin regulator protein PCP4a isoform X1 n=1 Tax=Archocentrus centrarchus TaxID=63155 RepID=UPI0011E9C3A7|nr:calmodulin regulator protein PCP4 isoform X1 [Archocentrus centrarchus]
MSERQASGPMTGNSKQSGQETGGKQAQRTAARPGITHGLQGQQKVPAKHEKKNNLPQDFDIDMDDPETEKAAMTIQSQFRKFQKKKQDVKS